jgi:hypothetical protein
MGQFRTFNIKLVSSGWCLPRYRRGFATTYTASIKIFAIGLSVRCFKVAAQAKPESADFADLVAWASRGTVRLTVKDFDMLCLFLRTLLPQVGGLVLMLARR